MPDKRISELPLATDVELTDLFVKVSHMNGTPITEGVTWATMLEAIVVYMEATEKGSGVLEAAVTAGVIISLPDLCGITSYHSNYGGTGTDSDSEGYWMDVFLNGVLMAPGAGNDYREDGDVGTGATDITFLYDLSAGDRITVIVRAI